jgi:hypothetical protein
MPLVLSLLSGRLSRAMPVMKNQIFTFASFILVGACIVPAMGQPNEADVSRHCSAFPRFCELITKEAVGRGLDPRLVDAVIAVESNYRPGAIGAVGEMGLMQVRPSTARLLGFKGTDRDLAEPATNIRLGVAYLAKAWSLAQGDFCRALMKYRAGHGERQMSRLSVKYCLRARNHLAVQGRVPWVAALSAVKECKEKRLSGELKTYVQSAMCSNPRVVQAFSAVDYKHMDLIEEFVVKRRELAEKLDRGEITEAQGERELAVASKRIWAEQWR